MKRLLPDLSRVAAEDRANQGRALLVTVTLFALVVMAPVTSSYGGTGVNLLGSCALVALVILAGRTRRALAIALSLGIPALLSRWVVPPDWPLGWRALEFLLDLALNGFVLSLMLRHIFTARRVGATTLLLAVNSYLLLGVIWAGAYILCETLQPGSFRGLDAGVRESLVDLYYFSFVTLATVGYGDVTPALSAARSLALAEMLCGVMFTAVLVARLIGLYTGGSRDAG